MNMPPATSFNVQAAQAQEEIQRRFITRVYAWMTFGLVCTAVAAFTTLSVPNLLRTIVTSPFLFIGLILGELALVIVLTWAIGRLSPAAAGILFTVYAILTGVTLSIIMLVYTESSIAITFGVTACTFGIMTLYGYTTQRDLTNLGSMLLMGLVGLIVASVFNLFFGNPVIYWITTFVGILIFVGLIAYDTQKMKRMSLGLGQEGQVTQKASILGALALYLDFINLFLLLLRILGRRK